MKKNDIGERIDILKISGHIKGDNYNSDKVVLEECNHDRK